MASTGRGETGQGGRHRQGQGRSEEADQRPTQGVATKDPVREEYVEGLRSPVRLMRWEIG